MARKIIVSVARFIYIFFSVIKPLFFPLGIGKTSSIWGSDLLLSGRKGGSQRALLAPAAFQVSLAQNNLMSKQHI